MGSEMVVGRYGMGGVARAGCCLFRSISAERRSSGTGVRGDDAESREAPCTGMPDAFWICSGCGRAVVDGRLKICFGIVCLVATCEEESNAAKQHRSMLIVPDHRKQSFPCSSAGFQRARDRMRFSASLLLGKAARDDRA